MIAVRVTLIATAATRNHGGRNFLAMRHWMPPAKGLPRQSAMRLQGCERVLIGPTVAARRTARSARSRGHRRAGAGGLRLRTLGRWIVRGDCSGRAGGGAAACRRHGGTAWRRKPPELKARVGAFLDHVGATLTGHTIVVAPPAVIRAAIVHATIAGTPQSFWRIDIAHYRGPC